MFVYSVNEDVILTPLLAKTTPNTTNVNINVLNLKNIDLMEKKIKVFIDIETDGLMSMLNNLIYIPDIKQFAALVFDGETCIDELNIIKYKNFRTLTETINLFLMKYKDALIIAHNGFKFDFIILHAHFLLYLNKKFNFNCFDSYVFIKKYNKCNNKNYELYRKYCKDELSMNVHTAYADAKMLASWFLFLASRL